MKTLKKLAIFCLGAMLFTSCTPGGEQGGQQKPTGLRLTATPTTIYDNGESYSQLTLTLDGVPVTDGFTLYDANDNVVTLEDMRFTSTQRGTFSFWASYGAKTSNTVAIIVVETPPAAPAAPADPTPEKTNFKRRIFLTQFTGTGCGYCPYMMNALYLINQKRGDDVVIAAAHMFNTTDPMYLTEAPSLDNSLSVFSFPDLTLDLIDSDGNMNPTESYVNSQINKAFSRVEVKGGLSVNAYDYTAEGRNFIMATVTVKAKVTTEFRVGAWLLEDNIEAKQGNNGITPVEGVDFNIHHNAVRLADSRQTTMDFSGHDLGKIEAGKTATREFAFQIKDGWKAENMHLAVFISTKEGDEWYVNNAMNAATNGETPFSYEE